MIRHLSLTPLLLPLLWTAQGAADTGLTTRECTLEPHMVVELSSPVAGVIERVRVDRGAVVRRGQVVVELMREVEQAAVALNRAELEFGEVTSTRNRELFEQKLISAQEKDEVELKRELARLKLAAAEARLRQRSIASPIDGVVLARMMDPGEYVGEEPILEIASLDPLYAEAVMPRETFGQVAPDMQAEVALGPPLGGSYPARIAVIDPVIDAASGTFGVRLELDNPGLGIPAGVTCAVSFGGAAE
ncbi:MAG: efflux RND transporter periplasmic adaptor subunit [Gammaproteobacteria bacterium]